jgi:hypothetical protein
MGAAGLPTEQVPSLERDAEVGGPVELPQIIPATFDDPEPDATNGGHTVAPPQPDLDDEPDEWAAVGTAPVRVGDQFAHGLPLRPVGRRPRVRKVTRVLRHIDPWSTFKLAAIFSVLLYGVLLTAGVLIWNVALNTGTVDNVERWFTQFGWETFELKGGEIYHNGWIAGLFGVVFLTGFAVLCATLFNLVSDMIGGIRLTVLEEEVVERTASSSRKFVVRRPPVDEEAGRFDLDGDLPGSTVPSYSDAAPSAPTASGEATTAASPMSQPAAPHAVEESPN